MCIAGKRTTLIRVVEFSVRVQLGYFRPTKLFIHRTKWTTKLIFRQKISLHLKQCKQICCGDFHTKNPQSAGKGEEPSRHNKFVVIHKQTQNTLLYSSLKDIKIVYTLVVYGHLLNCAVNVLKTNIPENSCIELNFT